MWTQKDFKIFFYGVAPIYPCQWCDLESQTQPYEFGGGGGGGGGPRRAKKKGVFYINREEHKT